MKYYKQAYRQEIQFYKILAHPVRLAILDLLRAEEACVCHIEAMLGLRQAYISQQLMALRKAGLVTTRREGLNVYYRITRPEIFEVIDAMRTMTGEHPEMVMSSRSVCTCPVCAEADMKL